MRFNSLGKLVEVTPIFEPERKPGPTFRQGATFGLPPEPTPEIEPTAGIIMTWWRNVEGFSTQYRAVAQEIGLYTGGDLIVKVSDAFLYNFPEAVWKRVVDHFGLVYLSRSPSVPEGYFQTMTLAQIRARNFVYWKITQNLNLPLAGEITDQELISEDR